MFQWAERGNLRDLYTSNPRPRLSVGLIKEIFGQLVGLADALNTLHNFKKDGKDAGSYRHGDLKPENILIFEDGTQTGQFRICDMGLARHHFDETEVRGSTATRHGTPSYEPPEFSLNPDKARSRQHDIWSMGCVLLELIVWLLYGNQELEKFNNCLHDRSKNSYPYWALDNKRPQVHPNVQMCMDIIGEDPECTGSKAIGDLLRIVKMKLLVVKLPPKAMPLHQTIATNADTGSTSSPPGHFRAKAEEFHDALRDILEKGKSNDTYWFTGTPRHNLKGPADSIPSAQMEPLLNDSVVLKVQIPQEDLLLVWDVSQYCVKAV